MQVQVQKVDAKVGETKLGGKLDEKHSAKDGTKLGIKAGVKLGVKCGAKSITILGAKLDVNPGAKLGANFASSFAPYFINGHKQHQKLALDTKRDANHKVLLYCRDLEALGLWTYVIGVAVPKYVYNNNRHGEHIIQTSQGN